MKKAPTKQSLIGMVLTSVLLLGAFFVPSTASAYVLSQQINDTGSFQYPGTSSNVSYATTTSFFVATSTVPTTLIIQVSARNNATTTNVELVCGGSPVANWTFDLTGYDSLFNTYQMASSSPQPGWTTFATNKTCYLQFATGDTYNGPNQELPRTVLTDGIPVLDSGGTPTLASQPFYVLYAGTEQGGAVLGVFPDIPSSVSTSTLASFCDANVPFDNSSIIQATITAIPNGLCHVGAFLIVPQASTLNEFSTLTDTLKTKIPFSYFYDVSDLYSNSVGATTTTAMQSFSMNLGIIDFASSTAMGPLLPASIGFLSSSTINQFLPAGMHDLLYNLMIYAIWLDVMWLLYHRIVPSKAKI